MTFVTYFFVSSLLVLNSLYFASSLEAEQVLSGKIANTNQFRFACALTLYNRVECTCFILDDRWIGTAAHCVTRDVDSDIIYQEFKVVAGLHDIRFMFSAPAWSYVEEIFVLSAYNEKQYDMDVALIKLRSSLKVQENNLQALKIPPLNHQVYTDILGKQVEVAGYGYDYMKVTTKVNANTQKVEIQYKDVSKKLSYITAQVLDGIQCCDADHLSKDGLMCVKTEWDENQPIKNICQGDSGAAVEWKGYAVLLASRSEFFIDSRLVAKNTFVKLGHHKEWIDDVMKFEFSDRVKSKVMPDSSYNSDKKNDNHSITKRGIGSKSNQQNKNNPNSGSKTKNTPIQATPVVVQPAPTPASPKPVTPIAQTTKPQTVSKPANTVAQSSSTPAAPSSGKPIAQSTKPPTVSKPANTGGNPVSRSAIPTTQSTTFSPRFYNLYQQNLYRRDGESCTPRPASQHCNRNYSNNNPKTTNNIATNNPQITNNIQQTNTKQQTNPKQQTNQKQQVTVKKSK